MFYLSVWFQDNNYTYFSEATSRMAYSCHGLVFFISNTFDLYIKDLLVYLELSEDNFRRQIGLLDPTMFILYHPDSVLFFQGGGSNLVSRAGRSYSLGVITIIDRYSLDSPANLAFQLYALFYIIVIAAAFFLSYFSKDKEEWQADADYTHSGLSAEAEKELFSIDDATYMVMLLALLFSGYFGFFALCINPSYAEFASIFFPLPLVSFVIIMVPISLISDFGLFFVAYLRGAAGTSSLLAELIYDYIGIIAYFTRLLVQFVRLVLMFVVYCMMHDAIIVQALPQELFLVGDSFWSELMEVLPNPSSITYYLMVTFPARLTYWIYEVLHTFFVVTVQFAAFMTIIFWLFMLFYTFFIYEEYEHHFKGLRVTRQLLRKRMQNKEEL
jgi:hypothetical protein